MTSKPSMEPAASVSATRPRLVCFINGIYTDHITGGDIYFAYIARAVNAAGFPIHFFGGHAFQSFLQRQNLPMNLTLTDLRVGKLGNVNTLMGQFRLLGDYVRRAAGTLRRLGEVQPADLAYGATDAWFDTLPLILCRARAKVFHLGMMAPTLGQIIFKTRADVTSSRLTSLYYWMSQQFSLRCFRFCRNGFVTYAHPEIRDYLLRAGYRERQLAYVANAVDVTAADHIPGQPKEFDVVWTGRVHPQKGIDDLLATLIWLKDHLPDFRAVIIGKGKDALQTPVREAGLAGNVTFSGLVSEAEKFRLLKASRVFVMPSRYESWGIVVGEALAAGVPVIAYDLQCYRPVFGDFVRYVKPFDGEAFKRTAEEEVRNQRGGRNYLNGMKLADLNHALRWETSQQNYCKLLSAMEKLPAT